MSWPIPCPGPPDWSVDWPGCAAEFGWVEAMRDCPQDPSHHAEGDVWTHVGIVEAEPAVAR